MNKTYATITAILATLGLGSLNEAHAYHDVELVRGFYRDYLHRSPDACGLRGWVDHLRRGASPEWVQAQILGSDEYYEIHGCRPEGFVAGLYEDVLGRRACRQEIHDWVCRLNRCGCRKRLAEEFLCAAERELALRSAPIGRPIYEPIPERVPAPAPTIIPAPAPYEYNPLGRQVRFEIRVKK